MLVLDTDHLVERDPYKQIDAYARLRRRIEFFAAWHVLDWSDESANVFQGLRRQRIRIGTMDLKIASIAIATSATLLSRNTRDFERIPNLHVEDWLS